MKTKQLIPIMILSIFLSNCSNKKPEDKMAIEETIAIVEEVPIEASLFSRLGGEEGISAIVDDIVKAHLVNPEIKQVFMPLANDPARLESCLLYTSPSPRD